ncbi:MAG: hypothetical protein ABEJ59_04740 [Halanaeroarchaeum sp.]
MTTYRGSDGRTYTDEEIWYRLETGAWRVCCWDAESGTEWVEANSATLLSLVPVDAEGTPTSIGERVDAADGGSTRDAKSR